MKKTVVYCSDGRDLQYLKASIFSVRKNIGEDTDIVILSDILEDAVDGARVIDVNSQLDDIGFHPNGWNRKWPYATLFRMVIPLVKELKKLDRVLYLDSDTLVLSDEAKQLFEIDTEDYEVVAAKDSNGTYGRVNECVRNDLCQEAATDILTTVWKDRKIREYQYVNAGVAIWCPKKIVSNGIDWYVQRLKWFWEAETRCKFQYLDQDFINSMMLTKCGLERKFNNFADMDCSGAVIKHFILGTKRYMIEEAENLGYRESRGVETCTIVYSSDGRDSDRLIMSVKSARKYISKDIRIVILTELEEYPGVQDVQLINPMSLLRDAGLYPEGWTRKWPFSCLFRLALPLLKELEGIDRVLYLDTDTLIRDPMAGKLFEVDSEGYEALGAPDVECMQYRIGHLMQHDLDYSVKKEMTKKLWKRRSTVTHSYVNSGVLVVFLDNIRNNGIEWYKKRMKWFWKAIEQCKFKFPDQDFVNVMMDVLPALSVRFNKFDGNASTDGIIQHFVSKLKGKMRGVAEGIGCRR